MLKIPFFHSTTTTSVESLGHYNNLYTATATKNAALIAPVTANTLHQAKSTAKPTTTTTTTTEVHANRNLNRLNRVGLQRSAPGGLLSKHASGASYSSVSSLLASSTKLHELRQKIEDNIRECEDLWDGFTGTDQTPWQNSFDLVELASEFAPTLGAANQLVNQVITIENEALNLLDEVLMRIENVSSNPSSPTVTSPKTASVFSSIFSNNNNNLNNNRNNITSSSCSDDDDDDPDIGDLDSSLHRLRISLNPSRRNDVLKQCYRAIAHVRGFKLWKKHDINKLNSIMNKFDKLIEEHYVCLTRIDTSMENTTQHTHYDI